MSAHDAAAALAQVTTWPVSHAAAAVITPAGVVGTVGDTTRSFRLASVSKVITSWAVLVAVEEGTVSLDDAVGPPGATLRHLLAHASGLAFDGDTTLTSPGRRRIYSNRDIELAAEHVAAASGIAAADYVAEAVLQPLGMAHTEVRGSVAHQIWSTVDDMARFAGELLVPRLLAVDTARDATSPQWPDLAGVVPGLGRFDPCPWGLGPEIRGDKWPHWTGRANSPATFGHFGGSGTFMWVDPEVSLALVVLTDRDFDDWSADALRLWPELSDAVLAAH